VLGAIAAFYILPQNGPVGWTVKSALLAAFAVAVFAYSIYRSGRARPAAVAPAAAIFGIAALSLAASFDPARSLVQVLILSGLAGTVLLGKIRVDSGRLAGVIIALAVVESVIGNLYPASRVSGTFVNANHHAALVATGYAVALAVMVSSRGSGRFWFGILQFVLLAAAAKSQSRALLVACPAALLSLALFRPRGFNRRTWMVAAALAAVCLAAPGGPVGRLADQAEGREGFAWTRLGLWKASLAMIRSRPLTGVGPGAFGDSFPRFRSAEFARYTSDYAHSEPLQALCELGIPGTGLLLWGLACWWRRVPVSNVISPSAGGLAGALLVLAVFGLTDFPAHVPVLLVIAFAAALGLASRPRRNQGRSGPPAVPGRALAGITAAFLFMIGLVAASDIAYGRGALLAQSGDTARARESFRRVLRMAPWHAPALAALAELDPTGPRSGEMLASAVRLRPAWLAPVLTGFERCRLLGDEHGMRASLARAEWLDPHGLEPALLRVRLLGATGDMDAAWSLLGSVERRWGGNLDVVVEKARLQMRSGRKAEAIRTLEHILRAIPGHVLAREWLRRMR